MLFRSEGRIDYRRSNFDWERIRWKVPSDDLLIKTREKRTDNENLYIWQYYRGELTNVAPIQIAYNNHDDNIVDYLLSRGAKMKVNMGHLEILFDTSSNNNRSTFSQFHHFRITYPIWSRHNNFITRIHQYQYSIANRLLGTVCT